MTRTAGAGWGAFVPSLSKPRLIELADEKLAAAEHLLASGFATDAYHIAGYAAELLLKAVISLRFQAETIPDPPLVRRLYTHDISELLALARLDASFRERRNRDDDFDNAAGRVIDWNESSRYGSFRDQDARDLLDALNHPVYGVLPWIRSFLASPSMSSRADS